ncbi:MAG: hypothetical protein NUV47_00285 [Patescibacteria group bacterium]|nr:hypothetical protein [Patescibacteria group bacterium]
MEKEIKKVPLAIVVAGIIIGGAMFYKGTDNIQNIQTKEEIIEGWGDLTEKMISVGVIDPDRFDITYNHSILNLLWALGLASKNPILESGEMMDKRYGGAQNFASTAGWTIAHGNPMDHYSRHKFFNLTPEQQALVDKMSLGIYRPCCGNSTHFPDCNHGMAMLGLLELMASQDMSEKDMWKNALTMNSNWFPDNYAVIKTYMKNKGVEWKNVNPQEILGANYSSAQGYAKIVSQVTQPQLRQSSGSCSV